MDLLTWVALIALSVKVVSFIKQAVPGLNPWQTQLVAWAVTVVAVFLGASVQVIQDTQLNGVPLADMTEWTKVYLGLAIGSLGSLVGNDALRAIDNNSRPNV